LDGPVHMLHKTSEDKATDQVAPPPKRRRVSIFGVLFRIILAIAILGGAGFYAQMMIADRPEPPKREPRERTFTVQSQPAQYANYQPNLTYFGEVLAASSLDIRSQVAGKVLQVEPGLAVGGEVAKGKLLATIDDFTYRGALTEAQASLAEAKFAIAEAKERLALEGANLDFVRSQYDLSIRDLERAKSLFAAGSITEKTLDDRELLVSQRQQAVIQRESNIVVQQAQLDRQTASLERIEWQVERAQRNLEDTKIYAPFNGIITAKNVDEGRVVSNNEVLISLYEASALEVGFTMSDQQYGQLVTDGLIGRTISVEWEVEPEPILTQATITRVGAQVDATKGGVEVFAQIEGDNNRTLRPGTFVKILVPGLSYDRVLRIPEAAIYDNSYVYVAIDDRMSRRDVEIVARDGAHLLVAGRIRPDTPIITTRIAQAGEGVAIVNEGEPAPSPFARPIAGQRQQGDNGQGQNAEGRPEGAQPGQGQRPQGQGNPNRPNRRQGNGEAGGITTDSSN
jgi:multidrug efflux pump subunit AcrA (membrane-fusion protein)